MIIATIADIHFNAVKTDKLVNQLNEIFLKYLRKHHVDLVCIAGDYFDSIISFNSITARESIIFMKNLLDLAEKYGIPYVRIIKGTSSHDNNQLENLKLNTKVDFKIFNTVTSEELDGYRILYLPEEYVKNIDEYYGEYFKETYNVIFGHGLFKEVSFEAIKSESEITLSKAPVFNSSMMCSICDGPIIFGHIHKFTNIKDKIIYVGSFSRWVYGETDPKGFLITEITKNGTFHNQFIENTLAERYDTVLIENIEEYSNNPESFIQEMEKTRINNLRINIIMDSNSSYIISLLREYYSRKPEYKLVVIDKSEAIKNIEYEDKINQLMNKYNFVFDSSVPHEEKISRFIKIRDKKDITLARIKSIIF